MKTPVTSHTFVTIGIVVSSGLYPRRYETTTDPTPRTITHTANNNPLVNDTTINVTNPNEPPNNVPSPHDPTPNNAKINNANPNTANPFARSVGSRADTSKPPK